MVARENLRSSSLDDSSGSSDKSSNAGDIWPLLLHTINKFKQNVLGVTGKKLLSCVHVLHKT